MLTEDDIRDALRACYATAPGHQSLNIVDLGLVEAIALAVDPYAPGANIPGVPTKHSLIVTLIAASPDEDAQAMLSAQIANCLAGLPELSRTTVAFAETPAWTPARISPAGRRLLQLDFPILNNRVR
jgi:metal-sulfur cluster biosynthetic enzyme